MTQSQSTGSQLARAGKDQLPVPVTEPDWIEDDGPLPLTKPMRNLGLTLGITSGIILVWSFLVPLERGALAGGQLAPLGGVKVVQHLEGGIVQDILVSEGDSVKAGQLLVRLAQTQSSASVGLVEGQRTALLAQRARLLAERDGQSYISFPAELTASTDPSAPLAITSEQRLFQARRGTLLGQISVLEQQIGQLGQQQQGLRQQLIGYQDQYRLIKQERDSLQALYEQGYASNSRILALDRGAASIQGSIGQAQADIARLDQQKGEARIQILQAQRTAQEEAATRLTEVEDLLGQSKQRSIAAADVSTRTEIRAPVDGTVIEKQVRNAGAVIQPGQPIMSIVPASVPMLAKMYLNPIEADNVQVGMRASIRMSGLDVQTAPLLNGRVTKISADAATNEQTGQSFYIGEVEFDAGEMKRLPEGAIIKSGLPVEIMIDGGSRTFASYVIEPIVNMYRKSFRG